MKIPSLRRQHQRELALQLVKRHLRTTPVYLLTGLPEAEIRALYRMVHQQSPPSGPMPCSASLCRSRRSQARLSAFASIYRRIGGAAVMRTISADALIKSYELFLELGQVVFQQEKGNDLDFTDAWVIARDLRAGIALLRPCHSCGLHYLVAENSVVPPTCPFCTFRKLRKQLLKARSTE